MIKIQKIKIILVAGVLLFTAIPIIPVFAAEISVESKTQTIAVGQQFEVGVFIDTDDESINAVEGKIIFPDDILELQEIRTGNSIINFWVEKPSVESSGSIIFSGITPGGYQGGKGLLLSLIFFSKKEGQGVIELQEAKTLLNDGEGTEANLAVFPYEFFVTSKGSIPPIPTIKDIEPPESFVPEIASDPSIFEGKYFLVFVTQDKRSGIDRYEIKEMKQNILQIFSKWISAESPYILQDQELRSYIYVKAIDKAGNERIVKILPPNSLKWYKNYENWVIIISSFVIAYAILKILWKKIRK